ncbi:PhzF family phenazine biosynthesis protein [Gluconobacter frateurii]|uniref:PhzF family phenazine biosynthesis protein n=1 Tax=Gluconobacter frateurii TaxID=38308 RepID=UPI001F05613A|nr:PhzF family phenazine biosynthesis protein [Gluconobacter frateurii]UMM07792.1 PhzF family phenazine biosynthesis protein [Gluconobacter frateurii]
MTENISSQTEVTSLDFQQVDVFSSVPLRGNPLAVVEKADALSAAKMAAFANWTNLSETTFLLKPKHPDADYRLRIFTPYSELPFAGHPTLGSCHVWLSSRNFPAGRDIMQECGAGLVRIRRDNGRLAFAAPTLRRKGPLEPELLTQIRKGLNLSEKDIVSAEWVDNGPGWLSLLLKDRQTVLSLKPDFQAIAGIRVGVVASAAEEDDVDFEVRAFSAAGFEDPVTGSLNAGIAQWLIGSGLASSSYIARQGTVLGRAGKVYVTQSGGEMWIGGDVVTCVKGVLSL